ncbi:MAG: hypothetical protein HPY57_13170 [Ignavibacteria bacterium]|nr:hypothetical protein [Ignavibacteria bacterium]
MFGLPVVHVPIFIEGVEAYIIAIDFNLLNLKSVSSVIAINEATSLVKTITTETSLEDMTKSINSTEIEFAFYNSGDAIYLFFNKTIFPYNQNTKFILTGIRSAIPITSKDDYLDIPEEYLELFIYYVNKYVNLLSNRRVNPDIDLAINNLEYKLRENKQ